MQGPYSFDQLQAEMAVSDSFWEGNPNVDFQSDVPSPVNSDWAPRPICRVTRRGRRSCGYQNARIGAADFKPVA